MIQILFWIDGGTRRSSERRVSCPCGGWDTIPGEEVAGWVWYPAVDSFICEGCGERVVVEAVVSENQLSSET